MPENGIWKGCGHKVKAILLCDNHACFAPYAKFLNDNPKEICFDCWKKKREHTEVKCPKCGREMEEEFDDYYGRAIYYCKHHLPGHDKKVEP